MTPADLAAALDVDPDTVKYGLLGSVVCTIGETGELWSLDPSHIDKFPSLIRYEGPDDEVHQIPITTTLPAAVARVRRMLEVP
jgi:hypothetical protein